MDPTQEVTVSEIASREIDPVLLIHLLTTDNFLSPCPLVLNGRLGKCHASYAVDN